MAAGTGGASCDVVLMLSSPFVGLAVADDNFRPLMEREGLKELELPMLFNGAIAAETDGLGL